MPRLPAYRQSHGMRYHPFPRHARRYDHVQAQEHVDWFYESEVLRDDLPPSACLRAVDGAVEGRSSEVSTIDIGRSLLNAEQPAGEVQKYDRRRALFLMVVGVMGAVRRKWPSLAFLSRMRDEKVARFG